MVLSTVKMFVELASYDMGIERLKMFVELASYDMGIERLRKVMSRSKWLR